MAKDPAALLYIDKWLVSTKGMRANAKGWYLNLILFQYDIGDLPNDIEELANLCDVRMSEFEEFKQVFEQVLKQKFEVNENNRLENSFAKEILLKRESFKEKRSDAGKLSYILKYFKSNFKINKALELFIKQNVDLSIDIKDEQVLKQVFKQISELYINVNKDINKDVINKKEGQIDFETFWELYDLKVGGKDNCQKIWNKLIIAEQESIIAYLPKYLPTIADKKFQPYPQTFLNQRRWENEIIIPVKEIKKDYKNIVEIKKMLNDRKQEQDERKTS
jgi:hypothetical protein